MAVSKPLPGVPIDPASPWARGLVVALAGNEGAGQRVTNYAPAFNGVDGLGTSLRWAGSPSGWAIKGNASSAFANFGDRLAMRGTGKVTVLVRFLVRSLTVANFPTLYSSGYSTNSNLIVGFNQAAAGNGKLWLTVKSSPRVGAASTTDFSSAANQNRWVTALLEYDGSSACNVEIDGAVDVSTSSTGTRPTTGRNTTLGCLDITGTNGRFFDGEIDYLFHWEGRTFTAAEKAALRANPWQLWPDEPQLVFAPAAPIPVPFYCAPQSAVSKPLPGQRIDPASPWARGLVVAVVGNQQGARVDNYAPALNRTSGVGTDLQTVGSPLGGALKFNGSTAVANFGTNANLSGTGKFCVAFRMNVRGLVRANFPTIYSSGYNGVEANLIIYFSANLADGRLFLQVANAGATGKTNTDFELAANQNRWFDVYVEFGGGTTGNIKVNGVNDYTVFGTQTRKTGFRNTTLGCIDLNGTNGRFSNVEIDYLYHWENRTLGAQEYEALRSNPWQLWGDDQIAFAPGGSSVTVNVTGFAGTGSVGNSVPLAVTFPTSLLGTGAQGTINPQLAYTPSGSAGTGTQGTPTYAYSGNVFPTGIEGTGAIGTPNYQALFVPAGSEGTGAIGSTAPLVVFAPTGVAGTGSIGTTTPQVLLTPTGYVGTGDVGSVTFTIASTFIPAGLEGVSALGSTLELVTLTPTGQAGTGSIGTPTFASGLTFVATGVEGVGALGGVYPVVTFTPAGLAGTSAQGSPVPQVAFNPTGQAGAGQQGSVAFIIGSTYSPAGLQAAGQIGNVTLLGWLVVQDGQTPGWGAVANTQTPSWSQVTAAQTPGWSQPSTAQTPSWTDETTTQVPIWTPVDTQE